MGIDVDAARIAVGMAKMSVRQPDPGISDADGDLTLDSDGGNALDSTSIASGRADPGPARRHAPADAPMRIGQAQAFIARSCAAAVGIEEIELSRASGRVLARDLFAGADLPRFDAAAVDGYALRSEDLREGATVVLRVVGRSAAGNPCVRRLCGGEAMRTFTGAPVPIGADLVLMQEDCRLAGDRVVVSTWPAGKANIRRRGEDVARGALAIGSGSRLGPAHLALAGALHRRTLPVYRCGETIDFVPLPQR